MFYLPHKPVIRETAERTKLQVVYDAMSRPNINHSSLNDCLETGPPLQNKMPDIMVRNCMHPTAITDDLKQTFLQIRIMENNGDVLYFHWISNLKTQRVQLLKFTRAIFGLNQSPSLLGGTLEHDLEIYAVDNAEMATTFQEDLYVKEER